MTAFEALRRVLRYAAPFRARFAVKIALLVASVLPLVLLPWPGKIVIDHVIEGAPLDPAAYPFFVRPFVALLVGIFVVIALVLGVLGVIAYRKVT